MVEAGVAAIANPLINIMLQGRHDTFPKRRGLTRVKEMQAHGIRAGLAAAARLQIHRQRLHIGRAALGIVACHGADAAFDEKPDFAGIDGGEEKRERAKILRRQGAAAPEASRQLEHAPGLLEGFRVVRELPADRAADDDRQLVDQAAGLVGDLAHEAERALLAVLEPRRDMADDVAPDRQHRRLPVLLVDDAGH